MKNGVLSILGILILALLLGSCATTPKAAIVKEGIVGHWEGDCGSMYLKVVGGKIRGVYTHDEGRVIGTFANSAFKGWWSEAPSREAPSDAGAVEFRFVHEEGKALALDGRWKYGNDPAEEWSEDWDLQWTDKDIPADVDALFSNDEDFPEG